MPRALGTQCLDAQPKLHGRAFFRRRITGRAGIAGEHFIARLHRHARFPLLAIPDVTDFHLASHRRTGDRVNQIVACLYGFSVHCGNHIAALQSRSRSWAAGFHALNGDSVRRAKFLQHRRVRALLFLKTHANRAARDFAVLDEVVIYLDRGIGRQRKSYALISTALRLDRCINADHLPGHVHQRSA